MENEDATLLKSQESVEKRLGRTTLLDSGEDFEMLEVVDDGVDDDLPPLEDAGGGKKESQQANKTVKEITDPSQCPPQEEWLDVLGNGQLRKKVLEAGSGPDSKPQRGQNVTINLKTTLTDGSAVQEESNMCFTLGDGDVIQALDLTVQLMEMGEKALIETKAKYAYGALGSSTPVVPPNTDLVLEVHLLSAVDAPDLELLPPSKRIGLASKKREQGNVHYQRGDYAFAVNSYGIALQITEASSKVDISPQEEVELLDVKLKCLNNMAAAQLKLDHYEAALRSCVSVLAYQPDNVKALFRQGKVLALQGEYSDAIRSLKRALKLDPSNKTIHAELSKLVKKHSEQKGAEQAMYKKMLGNPPDINTVQKSQAKSSWTISWKWLFGATAVAIGGVALSVVIAARN
ncbi:peptidyl-prolyl cis-trans isomerase FKBP8 isoform X2 [Neoarius graeffei]|uniref:peptidyl-prolyl cis-trans isomerase FKBP8 isoform X2 n=1 Tax=Neoarius graeffei TaxID=443677 RepID=UPI00298BE707|nr:peptidyl-prolyl cis-trans isomerase FKBP8 isoform X2 [Neoarius graeffei]